MTAARELDVGQLGKERIFFLGLLRLHELIDDPQQLLQDALEGLVVAVGASHGFIELEDADSPEAMCWYAAQGYDARGLEGVRRALSRGIVAEAIARGNRIHTSSAFEDTRFSEFESVQTQKIRAVLCAPIRDPGPLGVVYIEGSPNGGPFGEHLEWLFDLFVSVIAQLARRVLDRAKRKRRQDLATLLPIDGLVATSPSMRSVLEKLRLCAAIDVPILLTGETGTGKTMLARAVHANSSRASEAFVEINCATLPDALLENELFGSAAGGHSNAPSGGTIGRIGAAEGGTLLLDEVGDLSVRAQAKLLQFLQSQTYYRLGESKARRANVRILAATNVDLERLASEGRFRQDLLYRLQVVSVRVPSLSERSSDVLPIARHFLAVTCRRHAFADLELSPGAIAALSLANWPGNVRQLANAVESAAIGASMEQSGIVQARHLFPSRASAQEPDEGFRKTLQQQLHELRGQIVRAALEDTDWNVAEAARRLDIARSYLYKLIEAHSLRSSE